MTHRWCSCSAPGHRLRCLDPAEPMRGGYPLELRPPARDDTVTMRCSYCGVVRRVEALILKRCSARIETGRTAVRHSGVSLHSPGLRAPRGTALGTGNHQRLFLIATCAHSYAPMRLSTGGSSLPCFSAACRGSREITPGARRRSDADDLCGARHRGIDHAGQRRDAEVSPAELEEKSRSSNRSRRMRWPSRQ